MKDSFIYKLIIGLLMFCVIVLIHFSNIHEKDSQRMAQRISEYQSQLKASNATDAALRAQLKELNQSKNNLQNEYSNLKSRYASVQQSKTNIEEKYANLTTATETTMQRILNFKDEIEKSMQWFQTNSNIGSIPDASYLESELRSNCLQIKDNTCSIMLSCLFFVNNKELGYTYKTDEVISNRSDQLQSLTSFAENKGGDCEDYSLFFKAEYEYLMNICNEKGYNEIKLESWKPSARSDDTVWVHYKESWYLHYAKQYFLPENNTYASVVCGNIYDPQANATQGHCIVAFGPQFINSLSDLPSLNEATLIEPQDGQALGEMGYFSSGIILLQDGSDVELYPSYVWEVIGDNDLYLFSTDENRWVSYAYYGIALEKDREALRDIIRDI